MTVYVDEPLNLYRRQLYCHMFTDQDDLSELHDIATKIGLKRSWFQNPRPGDHPHYDIAPGKRVLALLNGAQFKPGKEWIRDIVLPRRARINTQSQETPKQCHH